MIILFREDSFSIKLNRRIPTENFSAIGYDGFLFREDSFSIKLNRRIKNDC